MLRLSIRMMLVGALVLTVVSHMILAWPYDTITLVAILPNHGGCPKPCWQGIRPGDTTQDEAINLLQQNTWVGEITADDSHIQWTWSGQQPTLIDEDQPGRILINADVVRSIHMKLTIGMGDLAILNGYPQWHSTNHAASAAIVHLGYPRDYMDLTITMRCPTRRATFWLAHPEISLQANTGSGRRFSPDLLQRSVMC